MESKILQIAGDASFRKFYRITLKKKSKIISSTLIRKLIFNGKLGIANKYLSRNWSIEGIVQTGRKMGRKIGFPTCNIELGNYIDAKSGVYAVRVYRENKKNFL